MIVLLLQIGCLERVTGEPRPLPEAFTAQAEEEAENGPEHQEMTHGEGDPSKGPFADFDGTLLPVKGVLISDHELAVDVDVLAPDPSAEGGFAQLGKLLLAGPGEFAFEAPEGFGSITLQAFQDLEGDGPGDDDPFGVTTVIVTDDAPELVELTLVLGGRELANMSAGAAPSIFGEHDGEWTTLTGTVSSESDHGVDFDVRVVAEDAGPSGDNYLGKIQFAGPGEYATQVPRGYGTLRMQVFQDLAADGPTADDPFAAVEVVIGSDDLVKLDIPLVVGGYALATQPSGGDNAPAGAPGGDPQAGAPGPAGGIAQALFPDLSDAVRISGTLSAEGFADNAIIDVDVFAVDTEGHGGRRYLGKVKATPGAWSFDAPRGFGELELEAIIDSDGDGPTPGDPRGVFSGNPLRVGKADVTGVDIAVVAGG